MRPGDLVALCMHNSPDFVFAWLGLWAVGAAPAMINHNLAGEALVGCLDISTAKLVLVDDDDQDVLVRMQDVSADLETRGMVVVELSEVRRQVGVEQPVRPDDSLRKGRAADDPMALFYTRCVRAFSSLSMMHRDDINLVLIMVLIPPPADRQGCPRLVSFRSGVVTAWHWR